MSLINDALRRAKKAQQEGEPTPPPVPNFRPVEPVSQAARPGLGLLLPTSLGLVALLALLLVWVLFRQGAGQGPAQPNSSLNVSARTLSAAPSSLSDGDTQAANHTATSVIEKAAAPTKPVVANTGGATALAADHAPAVASSAAPLEARTNQVSAQSGEPEANSAVAVEPAAPAPLKLQGIVFNPRRPSALINGRVMFVGERIRDLRLTSIHPDHVVLSGSAHTNVLSLEP